VILPLAPIIGDRLPFSQRWGRLLEPRNGARRPHMSSELFGYHSNVRKRATLSADHLQVMPLRIDLQVDPLLVSGPRHGPP
jgi:hypothetical protein